MIDLGLSITSLAVRNRHGRISSLNPLLWRDPSDLSTLFQDAEGLVPVTSAGDPVRRLSNKGTLGGYFLAPSAAAAPNYQTDGTYHWLESDGVDDVLMYNGLVPFSREVFEAIAFRTISINRAFPHIINNRGSGGSDLQQRHPLIFTPRSNPDHIVFSFGGPQNSVSTGASIVGTDIIATASNSSTARVFNANGQVSAGPGVALEGGGTEPYRLFGPQSSNIRDYGGIHMNRVPNTAEEVFIRRFYATKSEGVA